MGDFWLTTLTAIREGNPDWGAIAAYEAPIRRYLARRFPRLPASERDDLTQEVLLAMRERVVERYDAGAGKFRAFLSTVITNTVRMHYRRRRPTEELDPQSVAEPEASDVTALDLEARIVRAIQRVHDAHAQGDEHDLRLIYVLSGVLVAQRSNKEIAAREGISVDQVKRTLQRARGAILQELFLDLAPGADAARAAELGELARACLRSPRKERRLLEGAQHAELISGFTAAVRGARDTLGSDREASSLDLLQGIDAIFQ